MASRMAILLVLLPGNILASGLQVEQSKSKVLASKIDTITLHKDRMTSSRRIPAIPQLKCIGGNAIGLFEVDSMRCRAQGPSYSENDIQWSCTADTSPDFKLGSTQVLCEGYDDPDDPYILKGSCGVEYRLVLTKAGEAKYGTRREPRGTQDSGSSVGVAMFMALFAVVAFIIGRGIYIRWSENRGRGGRLVTSAQHGGDSDDNDGDRPNHQPFNGGNEDTDQDAPPPYTDTPGDDSKSHHGNPTGNVPFGYRTAGAAAGLGAAGAAMYANSRYNQAQELNGNGEGSSTAHARIQNQMELAREIRHRETLNAIGARQSTSIGSSSFSHTRESTGFGGTTRR